jgi:hypothetical protein
MTLVIGAGTQSAGSLVLHVAPDEYDACLPLDRAVVHPVKPSALDYRRTPHRCHVPVEHVGTRVTTDDALKIPAHRAESVEVVVIVAALAFGRDLPNAEINVLDGGHFLLESRLDAVVALIRPFLAEYLG